MFKKIINSVIITSAFIASNASAQDFLSDDERLSCEAILCLSSSVRPGECSPSLNRYFGITHKKLSKMISKRRDFLNICPTAHEPNMPALVNAIANGAGRCDAAYLNSHNVIREPYIEHVWVGGDAETKAVTRYHIYVKNVKPNYCDIYENHEYTDLKVKYVGSPREGGFWVEGKDYESALQEYNAKQVNKNIQNSLWNRN